MTVRAAFAIALMLVSFTLLVGCGESEGAKVDDGGSQASGTQPAAERTAAEKTVKVSSVGRPAVARARDVEARAGEGAMARAGDAVAHAGPGATARRGDAEARANIQANGGKITKGADAGSTTRNVTVEVGGERGTRFSGTCSVGDEEKHVDGRVPQSYSYEPGGERLECEIRKNGPGALEVTIISGDDFYSVHRLTGAASVSINLMYSDNKAPGGASSQSRVSSVVSSVISSTKSQ